MRYKKKEITYKVYRIGYDEAPPSWIANSRSLVPLEESKTKQKGSIDFLYFDDETALELLKKLKYLPLCKVRIGDKEHYAKKGDCILKSNLHEFSFCRASEFEFLYEKV